MKISLKNWIEEGSALTSPEGSWNIIGSTLPFRNRIPLVFSTHSKTLSLDFDFYQDELLEGCSIAERASLALKELTLSYVGQYLEKSFEHCASRKIICQKYIKGSFPFIFGLWQPPQPSFYYTVEENTDWRLDVWYVPVCEAWSISQIFITSARDQHHTLLLRKAYNDAKNLGEDRISIKSKDLCEMLREARILYENLLLP